MNLGCLAWLLLSFVIVALGQPAWMPWLGPVAAAVGFAFFWRFLDFIADRRAVFWISLCWFGSVQLVQLSCLTSIEFQGLYILGVYVGLSLFLGLQFAVLSIFVKKIKKIRLSHALFIAAMWTLIEWSRLFVLCGFSFNFSGMAMTCSLYSLQIASCFGILGMSFYVIFTNMVALRVLQSFFSLKSVMGWLTIALMPYLLGVLLMQVGKDAEGKYLQVALVQTGLLPSQKSPLSGREASFIPLQQQWAWTLRSLRPLLHKELDYLVLPEAVVSYGAKYCVYDLEEVKHIFYAALGEDLSPFLPPLEKPYAHYDEVRKVYKVSNLFWLQSLSNIFEASVIGGLDDSDGKDNYNAAFVCTPHHRAAQRYEKRVLLPLAEYLPCKSLEHFTKSYGISAFFSPGKENKVFGETNRFSVSICYEEMFPGLMQESAKQGIDFFVNITNDGWYPSSRLPLQHFSHSRVRAVENGIPLVRACNTGVTCIIDRYGRVVSQLGSGDSCQNTKGILCSGVSLVKQKTLFSTWGNTAIIGASFFIVLCSICRRSKNAVNDE